MHHKFILGDVMDGLAQIESKSVQCIITSPPYYKLRDYGTQGQIGQERTPEEYIEKLVGVFREIRRVLRDDGVVWINIADSYLTDGGTQSKIVQKAARIKGGSGIYKPKDLMLIPARLAIALHADGWYIRSDVIWDKTNGLPESVTDRPTKSHEYIYLITKSELYFYDADAIRDPYKPDSVARAGRGRRATHKWDSLHGPGGQTIAKRLDKACSNPLGSNKRSVWTMATEQYRGAHYATFPTDLAKTCMLAGSRPGGG
jgi:DNA modification methylase